MKVIIDTGVMDIRNALTSEITDFEVAVMAESAIQNKVDCFVTRNTEGIYRVSQKLPTIHNTNTHKKQGIFAVAKIPCFGYI